MSARFGVQQQIHIKKVVISPHISGFASIGEWMLGDYHYSALGTIKDSIFSGPEIGYRTGLMLALFLHFSVMLEYSERTISYEPDPHFTIWGIEIGLFPGRGFLSNLIPFIRYEYERAELKDDCLRAENRNIRAGIMPPMRRR